MAPPLKYKASTIMWTLHASAQTPQHTCIMCTIETPEMWTPPYFILQSVSTVPKMHLK